MKSLEHIIREIREGKCCCEKKKDSLEHAIRKVTRKESSFADRTTKPLDDDVGGLIGSGTGGEPKLHKEAVGIIGSDDYKGNQFKSVRTQTPHIKPPAGAEGHSQAPENVSRQRTLAKEKSSMTMHGKVSEQAVPAIRLAAPVIGAGVTAGLGAAAAGKTAGETLKAGVKGGVQKIQKFGSYFDKFINPPAEDLARAREAIKTKPKPKHDEPVEAPPGSPTPVKPQPKAPEKPAEENPKAPPVPPATVPSPKPAEVVPQEPPAKAIPAPQTPKPEIPPALPAQTRPGKETKTTPKTPSPATPKELPKEVGPEMPAAKPAAEPVTKPAVQTIDIGTKTKVATGAAADTKTATQTAATPAAVTPKSAADDVTTTPSDEKGDEKGRKLPIPLGMMISPEIFGAPKGISSKHPIASKARSHRRHVSEEVRKKIENMPRPDAGDRKSIEYVGRKDADPKSVRQKTSRLATIKNVIDEAKKMAAKKTSYEDGNTKTYDYGKDVLVINPNQKRIDLDVEGNKLPKDYDNK